MVIHLVAEDRVDTVVTLVFKLNTLLVDKKKGCSFNTEETVSFEVSDQPIRLDDKPMDVDRIDLNALDGRHSSLFEQNCNWWAKFFMFRWFH